MGNPTIDLPAEASPQEILAQEENAQFQGGGYDLPADASPTVLQAARLIQDRFRQKPQPQEDRGAVSRFAGAAGGATASALGGGDAASAVELMTQAAKKSKVLQPLLSAGGGWGEEALGLLHDAAHDWAMGANQVKQWALPDAARKGDIAERGGEIAGGLAGLGGVAAQFGAAGLAMTGAGQQAAPVYFHVLAKTGSEEQAIQAAMPALGVGATYALPLGKIIAGAGAGTFGKLLLSGLGEGALGASQAVATDAILKKATGEQMSFLKDGAEAGGFGFLTTTILGMLHMAGAKLGKAEEGAASPGIEPGRTVDTPLEEPQLPAASGDSVAPTAEAAQEAPGAGQTEAAPPAASEPNAPPGEAGAAQEPPKLHQLSYEELSALETKRKAEIAADEERVGVKEIAKKLDQLQRRAGDAYLSQDKQDAAQAEADKLEASLTDEQKRVIFGIGETQPQPDEIRAVKDAVGNVNGTPTPEDLAFELKWSMGKLSGIAERVQSGEEPGSMRLDPDETKALAVVRAAQEHAASQGWDFAEIQKKAAQGYASRFADPEDAAFMLRAFAPKKRAATTSQLPIQSESVVQEPPKPDATQELPRSSAADLGDRKQATLSGEIVGRGGLANGPTRSWTLRLDDGTDVHVPAQDESYNIGDRVTLKGRARKNERVQFTMPGEPKPPPEYAWVLGKHELVSVDRPSDVRSPWNPTAEETKARLQSRVDATAPRPDPTQELLYGGIPPLFSSKKVSSEGVRQALDDGIRKRGATPEQAFLATEHAHGEVNEQAAKMKILSRRLERAMTKEWGKKAAQGQEAKDRIQEALTNPDAMMSLPDSIREHAIALRAHADQNARTMVDQGMVDTPMAATFEKGQGKHLRRQYQAHSDPEWAQKIEPDVRNRLKSLLVSWAEPLTKGKESELQGKIGDKKLPTMERRAAEYELGSRKALQGKSEDQIVAQMEHMLADAKDVADNPWASLGASKLKRKDLSLFTARKGLPEEMRAFLGEIKDPLANYASTVMKQAQVIAAHHKFEAMRADGMGKWLFEEPTIKNGAKYVVEVTSGGNKALEPLTKGKPLYTTEEIANTLFKAQPAQNNKAWRMAIATNAFLKAGKTVLSPTTIAKQVWQNFTTALRSGHVTDWPKYTKDALSILTGKDEAGLLEATRHGLIGESVAGVEHSDLKRTLGDKELSKPYRGVKAVNDTMGAAFQYPDAFAKIVAWKSETARLVENGMQEARAKEHAADIVRNLYPTASRIKALGVVKGVDLGQKLDRFRKQPVLGTFMGWNSEKIRTTVELYKLIHQELHSGSPELRANALKRIGWAVAGEAALPASVLAYNMLNGIDKQEDSDRRQHLPPWEKEKNVLWLGGKDKGKYLSMSDIDSNAWTTDSMLRLAQGEDIGPILEDALRENVAPFVEPSMLSQVLTGLVTGVDTQFLPGEGKIVEARTKDRGSILWDAVKPGLLQSVKHNKGLDFSLKDGAIAKQLVGLSGFKPQDYDVRDSLKYGQYNFLDALQEAKDSEPKRRAAFKEASEKAQSAIRLGLKYDEVRSILREKLGNPTIDAILTDGYIPYKPRKK